MSETTANSMNILIEKPDTVISSKVPARMKGLIDKASKSINVNASQYVKLAIKERIEKDLDMIL